MARRSKGVEGRDGHRGICTPLNIRNIFCFQLPALHGLLTHRKSAEFSIFFGDVWQKDVKSFLFRFFFFLVASVVPCGTKSFMIPAGIACH